jgi:hypothetical protein
VPKGCGQPFVALWWDAHRLQHASGRDKGHHGSSPLLLHAALEEEEEEEEEEKK